MQHADSTDAPGIGEVGKHADRLAATIERAAQDVPFYRSHLAQRGASEFGDLPTIEGDPTQMRQLLQNLISNALKFRKTDVGPVVRLSAEMKPATGDNATGSIITLTIADNGIGFDNQFKEQIFTIFQRLHSRNEYVTGIGLATCRKIVERHGGTIEAFGEPGVGSKFIITLPQIHTAKERVA